MMKQKGVYPYDYMDSFEKFDEVDFPPIEKFHSILTGSTIKIQDYDFGKRVYEKTGCKNLGDYHDVYLKTDVLLLADVFSTFKKLCHEKFDLDPLQYFTLPGLSWDALFKKTAATVELLQDYDKYLFFESMIRGGICQVSKRYSVANIPGYDNYNPSKPNKWLIYVDANNLYGTAMQYKLPVGEFEWLNDEIDVMSIEKDGEYGYVLNVDLEYSEELHDYFNDYCPAPVKSTISKSEMSEYQRELFDNLGKKEINQKKLILTLKPKKGYVIHFFLLQHYISIGVKVIKINRVMRFKQEKWMSSYINMNNDCRKLAKNDFEKDFFKLLNNSVYGKTIEDVRKRIDIKIETDTQKIQKQINKESYNSRKVLNHGLNLIKMDKRKIILNKPIYVGACILDISKLIMSEFHFGFMKEKYGSKVNLLYTDTDSFIYEVETEDIYEDIFENKHLFDLSNYPPNSEYFSAENKKVLGRMKDEMAGIPIKSFVGLRPKMYHVQAFNDTEIKKAKGIGKQTVNKEIKKSDFENTLFDKREMNHSMMTIRSFDHIIKMMRVNKKSLSCFDDKRYILGDGIQTLAYGHQEITRVQCHSSEK